MNFSKQMTDFTTENKILEAAELLFTQKGYDAVRMRDIAAEAGVNLALINYYYKSKEKLFAIVMRKKLMQFFGTIVPCLSNENISLEKKINTMVDELYKVLSSDNNLPIFIFSEIQKQNGDFVKLIPAMELKKSSFFKQISARKPNTNPLNYILNMLSMTIWPFVMMPLMIKAGITNEQEIKKILKERIELIPQWMKQILEASPNPSKGGEL